ncbi:hypothetical protein ACOMHN_007027 [Nucella lapillus]
MESLLRSVSSAISDRFYSFFSLSSAATSDDGSDDERESNVSLDSESDADLTEELQTRLESVYGDGVARQAACAQAREILHLQFSGSVGPFLTQFLSPSIALLETVRQRVPHPDLQSAVGNAPLSSKHPTHLPTTDCLLSITPLMGGQPSDAPALSPPSPLQQGGQSSNAPALSPPSPLPQGSQPIALVLSPSSPLPQDGQPSDAPGLSPSSSTLLLCPSDSTLSICHLNSQSAVKTDTLLPPLSPSCHAPPDLSPATSQLSPSFLSPSSSPSPMEGGGYVAWAICVVPSSHPPGNTPPQVVCWDLVLTDKDIRAVRGCLCLAGRCVDWGRVGNRACSLGNTDTLEQRRKVEASPICPPTGPACKALAKLWHKLVVVLHALLLAGRSCLMTVATLR